jgi:succinoglycan biosynthesis protein ExoM
VVFAILTTPVVRGYHPPEMNVPDEHIAVCVCTYKRPVLLTRLLETLSRLRTDGLFSISVTVVDNDHEGSGREPVLTLRPKVEIPVNYCVEPERNISLARNRSIACAEGSMLAFIDDDEFPDEDWLINHFRALRGSTASGVLGPVRPHFDVQPPAWLVKSGILARREFMTGEKLADARFTRTGNVLFRRPLFADMENRFDPKFGRTGGGDAAFFKRMIEKGYVFIWCNEAVVHETVPPERQVRSYYLKRAFTRGMTEALERPFLDLSTLRSIAAVPLYALLLPFAWLAGQHYFMRYLVKECDHLSRLLAYAGIKPIKERPY